MEITKKDIGKKIYSSLGGWGIIKDITADERTPVDVKYDGDGFDTYSLKGEYYGGSGAISLFWDIPIEPPKPKKKIKKEGWTNIYKRRSEVAFTGDIFETRKLAEENGNSNKLDVVRVEWEEEE
jgi:hypothetical protein